MSAVEDYLQANAEFESAKKELSTIAEELQMFAAQLARNPETTQFANTNVGLPMDISVSSRTKSFDATQWPTPERIQTAIAKRFNAKRKVQTAWGAVPRELQASLVAPKF